MPLNITALRRRNNAYGRYLSKGKVNELLDVAEAAKRHSDSFKGASGVLVVDDEHREKVNDAAQKLDKLLEDVDVDDA